MNKKYREWNLWHGESQTLCKGERYPGENIPVIETKAVDEWRGMSLELAATLLAVMDEVSASSAAYKMAQEGVINYQAFKKELEVD